MQSKVDGSGTQAAFNSPHGVAVDTRGNVFVGDSGNHLIRKVTPAGVVTTVLFFVTVPFLISLRLSDYNDNKRNMVPQTVLAMHLFSSLVPRTRRDSHEIHASKVLE